MKKFKRILIFALVAVMMIPSILNVNVLAEEVPTDQDFIEKFTLEIFELEHNDMFIDLVELLFELSDPSGFSDAYAEAFGQLAYYQRDRLASYQLTTDAVVGLVNFMNSDSGDFSMDAVRNYIETNDQAGFITQIEERIGDFKQALADANVDTTDPDALKLGFDQMDEVFGIIEAANNPILNLKFLEAKTTGGNFTFNRTNATNIINLINEFIGNDIDSIVPVLDAMQEFVDYYNGLEQVDQNLIYAYLYNNNFVKLESSYHDDDDDDDDDSTPTPPVVEEPTTPEDIQNQVEEESKVEIEPVVTSEGTLEATVEATDLSDAWEKTQEVLEEVEEAAAEANKTILSKVVLEVPTTEDVEKVDIALPVEDIQDLEKDGLDLLQINSQVGTIEFNTSSIIEEGQTATEIKFSMETVSNVTHEGVPEGAIVVDFNLSVDGEKVSKFKSPIKVAIPYQPKEGDKLDEITVYFLQEDGTSIPVGGVYNEVTGKVEFTTNHFSKYYAKTSRVSFNDVADDYWAKDYIEVLAGKGIINGKGNEQFDPSADITRAEFVALITRMLNLVQTDEAIPFTDIEETAWYADEIPAAYQIGLINGRSNTTFVPNDSITRQEAAVVIANTLDYLGYNKEEDSKLIDDAFTDYANIASWANKSVSTTYREEIINGKLGNIFDPTGNTTRAEVAKMMYILFKK